MNNEEQINNEGQINNEETNKIKIIFQKQEDGSYGFTNVDISGNQPNEEECKIIKIDKNKFQDICNGEDINFRLFSSTEKQNIVLELDEETSKDAIEFAKNKNTEIEDLKQLLEERFKNIERAELKEFNGLAGFCVEFKKEEVKEENKNQVVDISKIDPVAIKNEMLTNVIGQDKAVETIVYNIYDNQLILNSGDENRIRTKKKDILFDGPTGTGKSFIVKLTSEALNLPCFITQASEYSAPGYTGKSLDSMLVQLLKEAKGNLELAERGIIVLDEFDKLGTGKLDMRDAIQDELLTYISGKVIEIEYEGQKYNFDTSKVTFICAGAFTDLREKKIREGVDEKGEYTIDDDDYVKFGGIKRELIGRLKLHAKTEHIGAKGLKRILLESKSSELLQTCQHFYECYKVKVTYSDEIVDKIVAASVELGFGARSLGKIVEQMGNLLLPKIIEGKGNITEVELDDELLEEAKSIVIEKITEEELEKINGGTIIGGEKIK